MKKIFYLPLVILLVIVLYAFWPNSKPLGNVAPTFETQLVDGSDFKLSDLKGKYVLIDFWASWCPPCIKDIPGLISLDQNFSNAKFKDAEGFEIVSIAIEKISGKSIAATKKYKMNWHYQIEDARLMVRLSNIANKYNISEIPTKFLINPKGEFIKVHTSISEVRRYLKLKEAN